MTYDQIQTKWPLLAMLQTMVTATGGEAENPADWTIKCFGTLDETRLDDAELELASLTGKQIAQVYSAENGASLPFAPNACSVLSFFNE